MQKMLISALVWLSTAAPILLNAQDKAAIEKKLGSQYALTKTTADRTDIVTAGAIMVLQKDNLMMVDVSSANLFQNTYKDGKITQNALGRLAGRFSRLPGAQPAGNQRTYVAGEKMWLTRIDVREDGVVLELYTDAVNEVRYRAGLRFAFAKGAYPPADQIAKEVAEVFTVQPADTSTDNSQQQSQPQKAAPPAEQAPAPVPPPPPPPPPPADQLAPIPPPPPPADAPAAEPATISMGQTKDQVVASLGQPQKIVKLGTKEIYYYKDLKITFVAGKVSDVQ